MRALVLVAALLVVAQQSRAVDASAYGDADLEALWQDAVKWEVGSNKDLVPAARAALVALGPRTLDFLVPEKLDTKDGLTIRALQVVVVGLGEDAIPRLLPLLDSERPNVRRNAADLLGGLRAREAVPGIACLLADPDARQGALSALAALGAREAVPDVAALARSDAPERARFTAASTLGSLGGPRAVAELVELLSDRAAPVRFAAAGALEKLKAVDALHGALSSEDLRVRLHAIAALGRVADPSARADLVRLLGDTSPMVRGFAVEALASMATDEDRRALETLASTERDPFVVGKLEDALHAR